MAKGIVVDCQFCGKQNRFYPPDPSQLGAKNPNQFQSTSRAFDYGSDGPPARSRRRGFWPAIMNSDAGPPIALGLFVGGVGLSFSWANGYDPAYAVAGMLSSGLGLYALKVLSHAPPKPKDEKTTQNTIKAELRIQRSDGKWDYIFDELRDKGVSMGDLEKAALAIYPDPDLPGVKRISVQSIKKQGMSYNHARKVLAELQEREWVTTRKGNKSIVTMYRGAPFLEKLLK
jgi:hypothetical protein